MEIIKLVKPTKEYENQLIEYKKEHFNNGEKVIHACSKWDKMDNYDEWLELLESHSSLKTIKDNWTVHTNFLGIRESDNKVVGMIDIRHELTNDFLKNYAGHIGYSVRPSERKKGYATQMLTQVLEFCRNNLKLDKVMISCDKYNDGSRKTIINAGGILEREFKAEDGENVQVYWIKL
ncbi:MAG: GNAT family N-acetyltransferase [Clostridia bacterium]|nr:GNAT family N-acetyltransferase [Clostridia bacterium]